MTETRAYKRGRAAARRGEPENDNPFHCANERAAKNYREWLRGHRDEMRSSEEIIKRSAERFAPALERLAKR